MPAIYLLRHGQASFGTDDYNVLSDLGRRQAREAGEEHPRGPARRDRGMDAVEFQRHLDDVIATWMAEDDERWPAFAEGAVAAVEDLAGTLEPGTDAVVATSAGVTAAIVGALVGASPAGVASSFLPRCGPGH